MCSPSLRDEPVLIFTLRLETADRLRERDSPREDEAPNVILAH